MTKKFPAQFGRSEEYRNPDGTLPLPSPENIPRPVWTQTRTPIGQNFNFVVTANPVAGTRGLPQGLLGTLSWDTPWFDLRPDLRSSQAQRKFGVPIWSTGARLYVQFIRMNGLQQGTPGLWDARAQDWIALVDNTPGRFPLGGGLAIPFQPPLGGGPFPFQPPQFQPAVDRDVTAGAFPVASMPGLVALTSSMSVFSPPGTTAGGGDGYPVRYWKFRLSVTLFLEIPPPAPTILLDVEAAVY